jgi:hypothetical protein
MNFFYNTVLTVRYLPFDPPFYTVSRLPGYKSTRSCDTLVKEALSTLSDDNIPGGYSRGLSERVYPSFSSITFDNNFYNLQ